MALCLKCLPAVFLYRFLAARSFAAALSRSHSAARRTTSFLRGLRSAKTLTRRATRFISQSSNNQNNIPTEESCSQWWCPVAVKGVQGDQGSPGPQGPSGTTGAKGDTGAPGERGPAGEQGQKGDRGPIGETGQKGDTGETGQQGPKGDQGAPGATGAQGPAGPGFSNGDAKGDIKYWDGTIWKNLGVGTAGQVLTVAENDDLEWTDK